jgi:hypothetical protein
VIWPGHAIFNQRAYSSFLHIILHNFWLNCLDYQSLKDYFSKTTYWKLNILVFMCFWKIALYCKLNFIFQNQFNQKLCIFKKFQQKIFFICMIYPVYGKGKLNWPSLPRTRIHIVVLLYNYIEYALWLKIACPGQITHQKFLFPLHDLTTAYKTVSQNFDI